MKGKKVLFLDRDGVIVNETKVDSYEKIVYIPHVFEALRRLRRESDFEFVMVSNQDGVGTPSYPYEDYRKCQDRIIETLEGEDIYFDDINVDFSLPEDNCPTRKPSSTMVDSYKSGEYELSSSYMVGDRITDMILARNIGCKGILLNEGLEIPDDLKNIVVLQSPSWLEILSFLLPSSFSYEHRRAEIKRKTNETDISIALDLDGSGKGSLCTNIGFFDHMLSQIIKHSRFAVALDFSGRSELIYDVDFKREYIGSFPTEMIKHFFKSFSDAAGMNLYIKVSDGNSHHQAEAIFKAFARAMRHAVRRIPGSDEISSTKGVL